MIEVTGLSKRFGDVQAIDGVSFVVPKGRITGLLGPNGAGKSTTLRILATVLQADAGEVRIDGVDAARDPLEARRRIGVLPHGSSAYSNLTARENIAYYAALQGLTGTAAEARVERVIEQLFLKEIADRRSRGFSQGQHIRVSLARCIVHDPSILILDEPTNGLDVLTTRALRHVILERRDAGCCVLFSSHVMQEVAALCDQIIIISRGHVAVTGTAHDIRIATGKDDLEDAFLAAVDPEDPA